MTANRAASVTPALESTLDRPAGLGVIAPPVGTPLPSATTQPSPAPSPDALVELPTAATAAVADFAAGQGTTFAGVCDSGTPGGALCYNPDDGAPLREGTDIRLFMRVHMASLSYEIVLTPDGAGGYSVTAASGPNSFTLSPP
jgi:hypothetical protein